MCAGHKIVEKKLKVFEYTGTGKNTTFKESSKEVHYDGRIKQKVQKCTETSV